MIIYFSFNKFSFLFSFLLSFLLFYFIILCFTLLSFFLLNSKRPLSTISLHASQFVTVQNAIDYIIQVCGIVHSPNDSFALICKEQDNRIQFLFVLAFFVCFSSIICWCWLFFYETIIFLEFYCKLTCTVIGYLRILTYEVLFISSNLFEVKKIDSNDCLSSYANTTLQYHLMKCAPPK